jgi:tetratricopeptide (TPR) repeat protein
LKRGLELIEAARLRQSITERNQEVAEQLWEAMGDILELQAQHEGALQAYHKAQSYAPNQDQLGQARLYRKQGIAKREQRLYAEALEACYRAESALGEQPDEDSNLWWDEWIEVQVDQVWAHYWLAQWSEMDALVNKLQPVVQERGNPTSRMRFLWSSLLMHLRRERYVVSDEMLANSRESLALSREYGDMKARVEQTFELGFLHLWRRELDQAEENLLAALELVETFGSVPMRTLTLTYLTVVCRFRRQTDGVLDYTRRALETAQAAQMPDYVAAVRGNQAWLAYRNGDLLTAEQSAQEAIVLWRQSPLVYPFQWLALWPLIAAARVKSREDEAWGYARALLEPTQQILPDELNASLKAAVQAREGGQAEAARLHLDRAMILAREMGYL